MTIQGTTTAILLNIILVLKIIDIDLFGGDSDSESSLQGEDFNTQNLLSEILGPTLGGGRGGAGDSN